MSAQEEPAVTSVDLLESGYWHVRWGLYRWVQWPKGRTPTLADAFGEVTEGMLVQAEQAAAREDRT